MRTIFSITLILLLTSCTAVQEMGETGEPPERWVNLYSAGTKLVTRPSLIRAPWNYAMGLISAATNGGIDLTVEEPATDAP